MFIFLTQKIVCKAFQSNTGLAAIFGPQSGTTSSHIQSICDTLEIPHIETRWDYRLIRDDYSVNLYPHPRALGQVSNHMNKLDINKHNKININVFSVDLFYFSLMF